VTSHDVVAQVRRLFRTRAVGHTGTLDPFATGVLVLVFGRATRLARFVEAGAKTYVAEARLGLETTTDDATGDPVGDRWDGPWPAPDGVWAALQQVREAPLQLPPAFSAKRVGGRRSHDLARRGEAVTLAPVAVRIDRLDVLSYAPPAVGFEAVVGPGTYIRAVARDLGRALGTGAHLVALRRLQVGRFTAADAHPLGRLTGDEPLLDPSRLVDGMRQVGLDAEGVEDIRHGRSVAAAPDAEGLAALLEGERLVAVAEARNGRWHPNVVLAQP
jgi:tRNA pseudouridine55 synthase